MVLKVDGYTDLVRKVTVEERRARLGGRHLLASPAHDVVAVANSVVALHSSDPITVYLSIRARMPNVTVGDVEKALYDDRALIRLWGMRRTLWVIEPDMVPMVHNSSTKRIGAQERSRTIKLIEGGGVAEDGAAWLDRVLPEVLAFVRERGEVLARDVTRAIPPLSEKIVFHNKAGRLMGSTSMSSRALVQLAMESRVIRARPAGSWISGQYRWAEAESWLGGPIEPMSVEEASAKLVSRWLLAFGPGTETDIKWWTGWPVTQVRKALAAAGAVEVALDDGVGYLHPDDLEPVATPSRWAAALPSLDPTTMGWKQRDWYLGGQDQILFDSNGNAGQTIWLDGAIIGGWAQRSDGELDYRLLADVGSEGKEMVESEIAALQRWLGDTRFTPRFASPLDKELGKGP
jgi:hypothetical protein